MVSPALGEGMCSAEENQALVNGRTPRKITGPCDGVVCWAGAMWPT